MEKKKTMDWILNLVFPEKLYCISCGDILTGNELEEDGLCSECRSALLWNRPKRCCQCGRFLHPVREALICTDCRGRETELERGVVCCEYRGNARKMVMDLKYGGKGYLAKPMGYMMKRAVEELPDFDVIVPVPMYRKKQKIRGYNQAELLAKALAKFSGKACLADCLERIRETVPMSGLSRDERRRMIKNAIRVKRQERIVGKTVLLVDDIFTTGSTGEECGRMLKQAGAEHVFFAAFAATMAWSEV